MASTGMSATGADRAVTSAQARVKSKARSKQDRADRKAKSWNRQPVGRYA